MAIASHSFEAEPIEGSLRALLKVDEARGSNKGLREKLISLQEKLSKGQLHLAILGQMKRGKSSFINALLGAEVLPTGVLPVTAIITEIRYGPAPQATVIYATGGLKESVALDTLAEYITEAGNPGNSKQVASVDVSYPSPFLEGGIVLIDTPGIGSTHAHNTQTTESYLEQVDAGIVVLSVDPPITEAESQFIRRLRDDIPKLFFILNKTDIASADEIGMIAEFLRNELNGLQIQTPEIFTLSARQALRDKREAITKRSTASGLNAFEDRLRIFLIKEKREVMVRSVALDALQIARTLRFAASIGRRAGELSPSELEKKRVALDQLLKQAQIEVGELRALLRQHAADILSQIEQDLKVQVESNVATVRQGLKLFQAQHRNERGRRFGQLLEDFLMQEVETVFQRWRIQEDDTIQAQLNELSCRFVARANSILKCLEKSAGELFEIPIEHLSVSCPLHVESRLRYRVERVFYSLDSFLLLLPGFLLRPVVLHRMHNNIPFLLDMNSGRIRYDYVERLQASISHFEKDLSGAIAMVTEALNSVLRQPQNDGKRQPAVIAVLDSVAGNCSRLLR
jgi:GTPase Era involved in 16S rRNA processing